MKVHNVYRCFDADGELLYVGVSWSAPVRFRSHAQSSPWWSNVARITLETFSGRRQAELAERKAIEAERPRFNKTYAVTGDIPKLAEEAAATDWQVINVCRNRSGTWNVNLIAPGGELEVGRYGATGDTVAEAVADAVVFLTGAVSEL